MPRTKREELKRKIAQAHCHLDIAGANLTDLYEIFKPQHPDYAEYLLAMMTMVAQTMEFINDFCDKAWGRHPEDYSGWQGMKTREG